MTAGERGELEKWRMERIQDELEVALNAIDLASTTAQPTALVLSLDAARSAVRVALDLSRRTSGKPR